MNTLLDTVRADPDDTAARLAYAEHLEDMGDTNHELVRLVAQVTAEGYKYSPAWERLDQVVGDLDSLLARLDGQQQRLFACDVFEHVGHNWGEDERRPSDAYEMSRRFARGQATEEQVAAAWTAARDAAGDKVDFVGLAAASSVALFRQDATLVAVWAADWADELGRWGQGERRWLLCLAVDYLLKIRN